MSSAGRRESLLIVTEPLFSPESSHFKFVLGVASRFEQNFDVSIATTYIRADGVDALNSRGYQVVHPPHCGYLLNGILRWFRLSTEATLWTEAWTRESLFALNTRFLARELADRHFDFVINLSSTSAVRGNVWWILGSPLPDTISKMAQEWSWSPSLRRVVVRLLHRLDVRVARRLYSSVVTPVAGSESVRGHYEKFGFPVREVAYGIPDLSGFRSMPSTEPKRFVLAYIGKEVEVSTLIRLAKAGIPLVGFGNKLVPGIDPAYLRKFLDFRGRVDHSELVRLYCAAEFTAFPFTTEGLGIVPLESMACGTPVLTYNREGPSETVLDGKTGWLVDSPEEFVERARSLWNGFDRDRFRNQAVQRALEFDCAHQVDRLSALLRRSVPTQSLLGPAKIPVLARLPPMGSIGESADAMSSVAQSVTQTK